MSVEDPVLRAARDRVSELVGCVRLFGRRLGEDKFADRMVCAVREGLADLDALPREDPFWRGWANELVTVSKLRVFAEERLARNDGDRTARFALVALSLNGNDGGLPLVAVEVARDVRAVADAVALARWVWVELGLDSRPALRQVLADVDGEELAALTARPRGERAGDAARLAVRVLSGEGFEILS